MKTGSKLIDYSQSNLFGIKLAFIELNNYQSAIEKILEEQVSKFKSSSNENKLFLNENSELFNGEYQNYLLDQSAEWFWEISVLHPHNFRASFLTQVISFIEYELKKICDHSQKVNESNISFSDLKGHGEFDRAKLFLTKIGRVNFLNLEPEWSYINLARVIRNKIIHQQGILLRVENDFKKIDDFVNKQKGLTYKSENDSTLLKSSDELTLLIISTEFTSELLKKTEIFFTKLLRTELKYNI